MEASHSPCPIYQRIWPSLPPRHIFSVFTHPSHSSVPYAQSLFILTGILTSSFLFHTSYLISYLLRTVFHEYPVWSHSTPSNTKSTQLVTPSSHSQGHAITLFTSVTLSFIHVLVYCLYPPSRMSAIGKRVSNQWKVT